MLLSFLREASSAENFHTASLSHVYISTSVKTVSLFLSSALLKPNEVFSSSLISPSANFICEFLSSSEHSAHKKL